MHVFRIKIVSYILIFRVLVGIFQQVGPVDRVGIKTEEQVLFVEKCFNSASDAELWRQAFDDSSFKGDLVTVDLKFESSIEGVGGGPGDGGGAGGGGAGFGGGGGFSPGGKRKPGRPALGTLKLLRSL